MGHLEGVFGLTIIIVANYSYDTQDDPPSKA